MHTPLGLALAFAAAVMSVASPARAGEIPAHGPGSALAAGLLAREKDMWRLYQLKDARRLTALTSDDFADLYSGGEVVDRRRWLADMRQLDVDRYQLSQVHAFRLSPDAVLFTYQGEAWAHAGRRPLHNRAAVTSVWARRYGRWLNVFYGETALTADSVFTGAPRP